MRNALLCTVVAIGGAVVVGGFGCSSSSTGAGSTDAGGNKDVSTTDTGGGGGDTGAPPGDSGGGGDAAACVGNADLYHRLGCEAGITSAVSAIAAAALMNADIASYFAYAGTKDTSGFTHPTPAQIEACLVNFLSNAVGGPDSYPTMADGFMCRDMKTAHADLYISGGSFDTFVAAAAGVLMAAPFNVSASDLANIGGALNSVKPQIVNPLLADAGLETLTQGIQEADASEQ
jgi:hypothetical protein